MSESSGGNEGPIRRWRPFIRRHDDQPSGTLYYTGGTYYENGKLTDGGKFYTVADDSQDPHGIGGGGSADVTPAEDGVPPSPVLPALADKQVLPPDLRSAIPLPPWWELQPEPEPERAPTRPHLDVLDMPYRFRYGIGVNNLVRRLGDGERVDHPLALVSLILGVIGVVFAFRFPLPVSILAWAIASRTVKQIERDPERLRGLKSAEAGRLLGRVGTGVYLFVQLATFALTALG